MAAQYPLPQGAAVLGGNNSPTTARALGTHPTPVELSRTEPASSSTTGFQLHAWHRIRCTPFGGMITKKRREGTVLPRTTVFFLLEVPPSHCPSGNRMACRPSGPTARQQAMAKSTYSPGRRLGSSCQRTPAKRKGCTSKGSGIALSLTFGRTQAGVVAWRSQTIEREQRTT